jgi:ribosomal protein L4
MNLLFSEEATNFKARSIALASALKIEIYKSLVAIGKHVIFTWIPSHI